MACSEHDCSDPTRARGFCNKHYQRWRAANPTATRQLNRPLRDRLFERTTIDGETGCWIWTGSIIFGGYGSLRYKGKSTATHRLSWLAHNGEIPNGGYICHKCDVPACINPDHLYLGTPKSNVRDKIMRGRQPNGERCPQSKLMERDVRLILIDQRKQKSIAQEFGVSRSTVNDIKRGRTWRHLP